MSGACGATPGAFTHLPGATTPRQPFQRSGSSPEGLRNGVLFQINTQNQPPASGVTAAPQGGNNRNNRLCGTHLDGHGDTERDKPQHEGNSLFLTLPSHSHQLRSFTKPKNTLTILFVCLFLSKNIICTDKGNFNQWVFRGQSLQIFKHIPECNSTSRSGKIYKDSQRDVIFLSLKIAYIPRGQKNDFN